MSVSKKFGLIGYPLGHSLSPYIHQRIMEAAGLAGEYKLYEVPPEKMDAEIPHLLKDLDGFNCTIPHKLAIMPYLQSLTASAELCGAVNTVFQGQGYNTDLVGFSKENIEFRDKVVLLLGVGGVAHMIARYALDQGAKELLLMARNQAEAQRLKAKLEPLFPKVTLRLLTDSQPRSQEESLPNVIINGTPVGMWPNYGRLPVDESWLAAGQEIFDTIYNPVATSLVLRGKKAGAKAKGGLGMLFAQALAAQKIWNPGLTLSPEQESVILADLAQELLRRFPVKYVFTGFMGAGKTTLSQAVAQELNLPVWDLDQAIEQHLGRKVSEIFAQEGEAFFRQKEAQLLAELLKREGSALISLGGGAIVQKEVQALLARENALVVYLDAPFSCLWQRINQGNSRPLVGNQTEPLETRRQKMQELYEKRLPIYRQQCDISVSTDLPLKAVVSEVVKALGYDS